MGEVSARVPASNDLARYIAACDYPGLLDEGVVDRELRAYVAALGIQREVVRIRRGSRSEDLPSLRAAVSQWRGAYPTLDSQDAQDSQDARDSPDAQAALTARSARSTLAPLSAQDARQYHSTLWLWRACYWYGDAAWVATTWLGVTRHRPIPWSQHIFEAFIAGCWIVIWTADTLYWVAKPQVSFRATPRALHCETGPAIVSDIEDLFFLEGQLVSERVVMRPETITVAEIRAEKNAETRRILRQRYGEGRYLADIGATVIDVDSVPVDLLEPGARSITRALIADDEQHHWLVAADGSTRRVYHLRVPDDTRTCEEAHRALQWGANRRVLMEG